MAVEVTALVSPAMSTVMLILSFQDGVIKSLSSFVYDMISLKKVAYKKTPYKDLTPGKSGLNAPTDKKTKKMLNC